MGAVGEFYLSIVRALGDQLVPALDVLTPDPLDAEHLSRIEARPGVYQLYEDDTLVYVGKTEKALRLRLTQHMIKLNGRLYVGRMTFTCLYVEREMNTVVPEGQLIATYKASGLATWNGNGFGNKDPGEARDTTLFGREHFDSLHPADLDFVCEHIEPGSYTADVLLRMVKSALPFTFRYETAPFHKTVTVSVDMSAPTADELFELLGEAIAKHDPAWQITALPGYVIMYAGRGPFPSARKTYP